MDLPFACGSKRAATVQRAGGGRLVEEGRLPGCVPREVAAGRADCAIRRGRAYWRWLRGGVYEFAVLLAEVQGGRACKESDADFDILDGRPVCRSGPVLLHGEL